MGSLISFIKSLIKEDVKEIVYDTEKLDLLDIDELNIDELCDFYKNRYVMGSARQI